MPARTRSGVARGAGAIVVRRRERGAAREVRPEGAQVAEIQRSRLLAAAVQAVDELGLASTTVADVVARSRVSRRTFYDMFANREECLSAVFEDILAAVGGELERAGLEGLEWRERVRRGLWTILAFLDREPVLARVLVVQALSGGPGVLGRREEVLGRLASVVDEGRMLPRGARCTPLTAEGLVGAAFGIVYARLSKGRRAPLMGLSGELMGMIVLPYLGPGAARREQALSLSVARPVSPGVAQRAVLASLSAGAGASVDPLESVPMRLTYRTSRVLDAVVELARGGTHPSNREVADYAGIQDPGQVSKLLRRLQRLGLLANSGAGHAKGEPNAWGLTARGELVARSIRAHSRLEGGVQ
jgi:AcrR family transcriptional regulator